MLNHPTHERLIELGLTGMAKAFEEQRRSPDLEALPFEDRIGLLRAGPGCLDSAPLDLSGFLPGYAERGALRFCRCVGRA
jgi:hypothetical protein